MAKIGKQTIKKPEHKAEVSTPAVTEPVVNTTPAVSLTKPQQDLLARKLAAQAKLIKKYDVRGGSASGLKPPGFYPTGLAVLDNEVLGIGGLPKGRIIEFYGPKSAGKSATAMHLAGNAQKLDPTITVKIYDREGSFSYKWGKAMGMDVGEETDDDNFTDDVRRFGRTTVVRGGTAETMANMIKEDLSLGELAPNIIIIDSIAVITTEVVMGKDIDDLNMRDNLSRADFLTKFFNSITDGWFWPAADSKGKLPSGAKQIRLDDTETTIMCINHAKERTKSAAGRTWVEWYSVGGVSLDFHACMQLMIKRIGFLEDALKNVSHQKLNVCADKNKLAPPKRECQLLLDFKGGLSQLGTIDWLSLAIDKGLAEKNGAWIKSHVLLEEGKIQGEDAFNKYIEKHDEAKALLTAS